jgi:hypothetical protein
MVKDEAGERQILPGQEGTLKQLVKHQRLVNPYWKRHR